MATLHYESMLNKDGQVRVQDKNVVGYDRRGWSSPEVLNERRCHLDELRADFIRTLGAIQAEMDAIDKQLRKRAS